MYNASESIRWIFMPIPIFSLTFGYISIINLDIIQYMINTENNTDIVLHPFDPEIAGPSFAFLLYSIPVYWLLVIIREQNLSELISCKKKKPLITPDNPSLTTLDGENQDAPPETERQILSDIEFFTRCATNRSESMGEIEREESSVDKQLPSDLPVRVK